MTLTFYFDNCEYEYEVEYETVNLMAAKWGLDTDDEESEGALKEYLEDYFREDAHREYKAACATEESDREEYRYDKL